MGYRHNWDIIKGQNLYSRWRDSNFGLFINHLKRNKTISSSHPIHEEKYDFRAVGLKKTRLSKLLLSDSDFTFGQFYSCGITNSNFENCIFVSSDFTSTNLSNTEFFNCVFIDSSFRRANCSNTKFIDCDLTGCDFSKSEMNHCFFQNAILDNVILWQCFNIETIEGRIKSSNEPEIDLPSFQKITNENIKQIIEKQGKIMEYEFDIAISFAGEDRQIAKKIASALVKRDVRIFYDDYEKVDLWGKNLYDHLSDIYRNKAKYCLILISKTMLINYGQILKGNLHNQGLLKKILNTYYL
jgi:uncharacterized protein YjbI with pentapeptide repeats